MSSQFRVTKRLTGDGWTISGELLAGTLPRELFVHENTGTTSLGGFHSVVHALDLHRVPAFSGEAIPTAKTKFVRTYSFFLTVEPGVDPDTVINKTVASLKKFANEYSGIKELTSVYIID